MRPHIRCLSEAGNGRSWGMQIAKRRRMARARVSVARKLAVILHRMWSDITEFRFGKEPGIQTALHRQRTIADNSFTPEGEFRSFPWGRWQGDLVDSPEPGGASPQGRETD